MHRIPWGQLPAAHKAQSLKELWAIHKLGETESQKEQNGESGVHVNTDSDLVPVPTLGPLSKRDRSQLLPAWCLWTSKSFEENTVADYLIKSGCPLLKEPVVVHVRDSSAMRYSSQFSITSGCGANPFCISAPLPVLTWLLYNFSINF